MKQSQTIGKKKEKRKALPGEKGNEGYFSLVDITKGEMFFLVNHHHQKASLSTLFAKRGVYLSKRGTYYSKRGTYYSKRGVYFSKRGEGGNGCVRP